MTKKKKKRHLPFSHPPSMVLGYNILSISYPDHKDHGINFHVS